MRASAGAPRRSPWVLGRPRAIRRSVLPGSQILPEPGPAQPRSASGESASEYLPEAVMYYFVEPATLKSRCPRRRAFIEGILRAWSARPRPPDDLPLRPDVGPHHRRPRRPGRPGDAARLWAGPLLLAPACLRNARDHHPQRLPLRPRPPLPRPWRDVIDTCRGDRGRVVVRIPSFVPANSLEVAQPTVLVAGGRGEGGDRADDAGRERVRNSEPLGEILKQ